MKLRESVLRPGKESAAFETTSSSSFHPHVQASTGPNQDMLLLWSSPTQTIWSIYGRESRLGETSEQIDQSSSQKKRFGSEALVLRFDS